MKGRKSYASRCVGQGSESACCFYRNMRAPFLWRCASSAGKGYYAADKKSVFLLALADVYVDNRCTLLYRSVLSLENFG